jgi:hypothetical protein
MACNEREDLARQNFTSQFPFTVALYTMYGKICRESSGFAELRSNNINIFKTG